MNERKTWIQTVEWVRMECETLMMHRALTLPEDELIAFANVGIRRMANMVETCRTRSLFNFPHAKLLMWVWLHLPDEQRGFVRNEPGGGIFDQAENMLGYHPALRVDLFANKHGYWKSDEYIYMIHQVTAKSIERLPNTTLQQIFTEYQCNPNYARINKMAVQWDGNNDADIIDFIGVDADFVTKVNDRLVFRKKQTNWQIMREQWVWFNETGVLTVGDTRKLLEARLNSPTRDPAIWIKPNNKVNPDWPSLCPEIEIEPV